MNLDPEDPRLTALALGELADTERTEVEARLASSPEAMQELEETRGVADLLTEAFAREAALTPAPDLNPLLDQALAEAPAASPTDTAVVEVPSWRFRWLPTLGIAAAATVIALATVWWLAPDSREGQALRLAAAPPSAASATNAPVDLPVRDLQKPSSETAKANLPAVSESAAPVAPPPSPVASLASQSPGPGIPDAALGASTQPASSPAPASPMSPGLMRRYGLGPAPGAEASAAASGGLSPTPPPQATLRTRYGGAPVPESRMNLALSSQPGSVPIPMVPSPASSLQTSPTPDPQVQRRGLRVLEDELETARPTLLTMTPSGPVEGNPGYTEIAENVFLSPLAQPLSTFGLDVDTGSYAVIRRFLNAGTFPPRAAVRVEEMINYFPFQSPAPKGDDIFGVQTDVAPCPWEPRHRLVRIAIRSRDVPSAKPTANLVFLVDVSGSMQPGDRLPLLKQALRALTKRLSPADRVAIVTYASQAGIRLPSTSAEEKDRILEAIDSLEAGGSTNGEGGIREAYDVARRHFIPGGVNRVLLLTDGDFNVGISDQSQLIRLVEEQATSGVFLTTLGVGTDNFKDALMRGLADRGNGSYHFLDSFEEAQRVLLEQRDATFITVARDAKAQVEFNPGNVAAWRQIGYEKRAMAAQDFNNDAKDGGEVGAGQTVTVLYEVVPAGMRVPGGIDPLKYQPAAPEPKPAFARGPELLTLKLRYQRPEGSQSTLKEFPVLDREHELAGDFRFAAAVAAFGMSLRDPNWNGGRGFDTALTLAQSSLGDDPGGWRAEFLTLVRKARGMPRRDTPAFR